MSLLSIHAPYWFKVILVIGIILFYTIYVYTQRKKYSTGKLILLIIVLLLALFAAYMRANPNKFY